MLKWTSWKTIWLCLLPTLLISRQYGAEDRVANRRVARVDLRFVNKLRTCIELLSQVNVVIENHAKRKVFSRSVVSDLEPQNVEFQSRVGRNPLRRQILVSLGDSSPRFCDFETQLRRIPLQLFDLRPVLARLAHEEISQDLGSHFLPVKLFELCELARGQNIFL